MVLYCSSPSPNPICPGPARPRTAAAHPWATYLRSCTALLAAVPAPPAFVLHPPHTHTHTLVLHPLDLPTCGPVLQLEVLGLLLQGREQLQRRQQHTWVQYDAMELVGKSHTLKPAKLEWLAACSNHAAHGYKVLLCAQGLTEILIWKSDLS